MFTGVAEALLLESLEELMCDTGHVAAIPRRSRDRMEGTLQSLHALADEQINAIDFHLVSSRWLALYTDVSLVRAMCQLSLANTKHFEAGGGTVAALEAVRLLDMALIIAGGAGEGRLEWTHRLTAFAQTFLSPHATGLDPLDDGPPLPKRRKIDACASSDPAIVFAPKTVPVLPRPPSVSTYISRYSRDPFVLRGCMTLGEACPPWTAITEWSDPTYILSNVGEGRHVPVEIGSAYSDREWGQQIVPLRGFLTRAGFFGSQGCDMEAGSGEPPMYLAQHSLFRQFPQLEHDITLPDYVWSAPPAPIDFPAYMPPSNREGVITNVWIGSGYGKIVSPAHTV